MSMEVIYVDSLFLINLIINYFLLLVSGKVCALPLKRLRFGLAAAFGAFYSVLVVIPGFGWLATAPVKIVSGLFMVLIAYGGSKQFLRNSLVFFVVSAAFGGAVYAASMLGGLPRGGSIYVPVSMRVLILSFALCYVVISVVFHRAVKQSERKVYSVEVAFGGNLAAFSALHDTGNELHDPASGCEVMVVGPEAISGLFSPELRACIQSGGPLEVFESLSRLPGCAGKFRLVPYSAVGVKRSLLLAFRPDRIHIDGREEKDLLLALSPTSLCGDGQYQAII